MAAPKWKRFKRTTNFFTVRKLFLVHNFGIPKKWYFHNKIYIRDRKFSKTKKYIWMLQKKPDSYKVLTVEKILKK